MTEEEIYALWERSGYLNPDKLPKRHKKPFSIIMPPPNANGSLHAGHALFVTLQDIIIRFKRMRGFRTLWLPGADHAGFETQIVYERKLEKEGRSRFEMTREELYREIMAFTLENKTRMENQLRRLGASCDWSREKFTLDPKLTAEVQKTFVALAKDGLVYRGKRAVHWCTKHQTSLSDLETESREARDTLYYLKYGPLVVATVRPETIFGDVAVAVHPKDKRYAKLVGTTIEVETPVATLSLKVIADTAVDPDFGTGALKITPAHDGNDFEIALRHNLPLVEVIDARGRMNERAGKYAGMKIVEARAAVADDLAAMGLIERIEEYAHATPACFKCGTVIEPRVMNQWFIRVAPLVERAVHAVKKGEVSFVTKRFEKLFFAWMKSLRDWNISRQIVWGIPIPARVCDTCGHGTPEAKPTTGKNCDHCGHPMRRETDVFDTWFSSGQWPFLTLGFPKGKDFARFYPTDVMETGYDILFFWVSRMVMLGLYRTEKVPFRTVYLHGLVNDAQGKKMSKSKGNVIDPIEIGEKYGIDALRMALVVGNAPGSDTALSEDKVRAYRNFATKLRNMANFLELHRESVGRARAKPTREDAAHLRGLAKVKKAVTREIEAFRFHEAAARLYGYVWHEVADKIIEQSKLRLKEPKSREDQRAAFETLETILTDCLALLHPFMPYTTEDLYQSLPKRETPLLMVRAW